MLSVAATRARPPRRAARPAGKRAPIAWALTCSFLHIPWRCPFDWLKASSSPPLPMTTTAGTPARRTVQPPSRARCVRACQTRPPIHSCLLSARAAPHSGSVSASRIDHTAISGNLGYSPPRASTTHRTAASARRRGCEAERSVRRSQDSRRLWTAPARRPPRGCHDGCGERAPSGESAAQSSMAVSLGRVSRASRKCLGSVGMSPKAVRLSPQSRASQSPCCDSK